MEKRIGYPHGPLDRDGKALCYNFSAHSGCTKDNCSFSHQSRIKHDGIHWAAAYELARRGGLTTSKRIEPSAVDGYLQALRGKNSLEIKKSIEESRNAVGRSHVARSESNRMEFRGDVSRTGEGNITKSPLVDHPRGGSSDEIPVIDKRDEGSERKEDRRVLGAVTEEYESEDKTEPVLFGLHDFNDLTEHVNPHVQPIPRDFLKFDCTDMEKPLREILYGSDHWMPNIPQSDLDWDVPQETSIVEGETENSLKMRGETGDRATYMRFRMLALNKPLEEAFHWVKEDLTKQGKSFMNEGHANGKIFQKEPDKRNH